MVEKGLLKPPFDIFGLPSPRMNDELSPKVRNLEISPRTFGGSPSNTLSSPFSIALRSAAIGETLKQQSTQPFSEHVQLYLQDIRQSERAKAMQKEGLIPEEDQGRKSMIDKDYGMGGAREELSKAGDQKQTEKGIYDKMVDIFTLKSFREDSDKPNKETVPSTVQSLPPTTGNPYFSEGVTPKDDRSAHLQSSPNQPFRISVTREPESKSP
jgi:hypothetical protein